VTSVEIGPLGPQQAGEVLTLQRAAYVDEARRYGDPELPPLTQTLEELVAELRSPSVIGLGAWLDGRLVGSVRVRLEGAVGHLGRLVVVPDLQGQGIGTALLRVGEESLPAEVTEIRLFTGSRSDATIRLYERLGYVRQGVTPAGTHDLVHLTKRLG
jgi:ribosomal protein S18 acetylase RimI-like enzyme